MCAALAVEIFCKKVHMQKQKLNAIDVLQI